MPDVDFSNFLLCYYDYPKAAGTLSCIMFIQLIYTIIIWASLIGERAIASILMFFVFFAGLFAGFMICRNNCVAENQDNQTRIYGKFMPIASFIMVIFSIVPVFVTFFEGADAGFMEGAGLPILTLISMVFTCIWLQMFYASS